MFAPYFIAHRHPYNNKLIMCMNALSHRTYKRIHLPNIKYTLVALAAQRRVT